MPRVLLFVPAPDRPAAERLLPAAEWHPHGRHGHWTAAVELPHAGVPAELRAACPGVVYLGRAPTEPRKTAETVADRIPTVSPPADPPPAGPGREVPADAIRSEEPMPAAPPPAPEPPPAPVETPPEPADVPAAAPESPVAAPTPPPAPSPPPAAKTPAWQALLKKKG